MDFIYNNTSLKKMRQELRRNQTEAEKALWRKLRNKQFYGLKFFRQYSIGMYILDFYCSKLKVAIELDGGQHAEKESLEHDELRSKYLKMQGIEVIRFWNNEVIQNMEGVLLKISEKLIPPHIPLKGGEG